MIHVPNNFHSPVSAFIHEGKLNIPENFQEHFPEIWQIIQSCSIPLIETSDKLVWSLQQMVTFILIAFFKVLELMFRLPCFGIKLFLLGQFFLVNFFILSYLLKIYFKKKAFSQPLAVVFALYHLTWKAQIIFSGVVLLVRQLGIGSLPSSRFQFRILPVLMTYYSMRLKSLSMGKLYQLLPIGIARVLRSLWKLRCAKVKWSQSLIESTDF